MTIDPEIGALPGTGTVIELREGYAASVGPQIAASFDKTGNLFGRADEGVRIEKLPSPKEILVDL